MNDIIENIEAKIKQIHRHPKQLIAFLVDAYITVIAFGRGTGKTHGVTATWLYDRAKKMPRSTGFLLSITYAHVIDTIIPAMQKSWAEMGLIQGQHYWLREKPPEELKLDEPITPVDNPKYFIFWINGSVTKLVSMDRQAMVNSKSFDYGAICEARKLSGARVEDDVIPTVRGNGDYFGHLPEHGSILIESDLPKDVKGKWFLKYKKQMDSETVSWIMQLKRFISEKQNEPESKEKTTLIAECTSLIDDMRRELVHWIEASTFDNIHALGEKAMRYLRRTLTEKDYDVSVLNNLSEEVDDCFYARLDDAAHGYDALNYNYIDNATKAPRDCRWDRDVNLYKPLDITIDYNLRHSCIDVYQMGVNRKLRFLKHVFVLAPQTHIDMVDIICDYYSVHENKKINLIYNSTFTNGEKVKGRTSVRQDVENQFKKRGWEVTAKPIGQAMWHEDLYYEWEKVYTGQGTFSFSFNRNNCEVYYNAAKQTEVRPTTKPPTKGKRSPKFYKNKSSERPTSGIPQQDATHSTESVDQILQYYLIQYSEEKAEEFYGIG